MVNHQQCKRCHVYCEINFIITRTLKTVISPTDGESNIGGRWKDEEKN